MKRISSLVGITLLIIASNLPAQTTADGWVTAGRSLLVMTNFAGAYSDFNAALNLDPNNGPANVLAAATRLLILPQQTTGSNFLNRLGLTAAGRNLLNWTATFQTNATGNTVPPSNFSSTEAITLYTSAVMPAIDASLANLARITDPAFTLDLTADETHVTAVTLDYGDILLLRALLHAGDFLGHTLNAHNFSVVVNHLAELGSTDPSQLTFQRILSDYPSLLAQGSKTDLDASKTAFTNAVARYFNASDFIRNVRAPGVERLFELSPDQETNEANFREGLTKALASVFQPVVISTNSSDQSVQSIFAGSYFSGAKSLRSLLPRFNGNRYVYNSLPDYTFGGVLLGEPACDTESVLRKKLAPSYAGIYVGQLEQYSVVGGFAMFVSSNQLATVVGYDSSLGASVSVQFQIAEDGTWNFETNGLSGWGQIYGDQSVYGTIYLNGMWVADLYGGLVPNTGPFQNAAGYYSGNWSGGGSGGSLLGVLSADGRLYYYVPPASTGSKDDGGLGQLDAAGRFSSFTVGGAVVAGTNNPALHKITGTFTTSDFAGTFFMNRGPVVPADVQPAITLPPSDQTVQFGQNGIFKVAATGSPPLCYQWYSNTVPISQATSSTLVVSNIQAADDLTMYSVLVRNLAGVTNASATLFAVPETNPPTLAFVFPVSGQRVSNTLAQVTINGTAKDNAAISNVWVQINGGDWIIAAGTVSWAADVQMVPGTNTVSAFAVDTSGNHSLTYTMRFVYVLTDRLSVQANGLGTISPNYSNAWLEIGKSYTMKATPAAGFAFTNWTSSLGWVSNTPIVHFLMQSNLALTASFVDVAKPTIGFTFPAASQQWGYAEVQARGWAKDNSQVAGVQYQLNNTGPWTHASGTTNWTADLDLVIGANTLNAYAIDAAGNYSTTNTLKFTYNQFLPVVGNYYGLFSGSDRLHGSSGYVSLSVGKSGTFSGSLLLDGKTCSLSGSFDATGNAVKTVARSGTNAVTVALALDLTPGSDQLTGTVSNAAWMADLWADRAVFNSTTNKAPYAGKYTLIVPGGDENDLTFLAGLGYGAVSVDTAGKLVLSGYLADGTSLSQSTTVSKDGRWPLYASLYSGKGSVYSWLFFTNYPPADLLGGQLSWSKPALGTATKYYPLGFTEENMMVEGSRYVAPTNSTMRAINLTNGMVSFAGGNLSAPFTNLVVLTPKNLVTNASTNLLTFSLTIPSGVYSGSVAVPGTKTTLSFKGALLQDENGGYGYFLGTNQSGRVLLEPRPEP